MQQTGDDREQRIEAARERLRIALRRYALAKAAVAVMREHHAPSPEEAGAETRSAPAKLAGGRPGGTEGRGTSEGQGRSSGH